MIRRALLAVSLLALGHAARADLQACAVLSDDGARLACYDHATGRAPAVAAPATAAEAQTSRPAFPLRSRLVGRFEGWSAGTRFVLENGETWQAVGASSYYGTAEAPAVVIERDFIGQYLMSFEGIATRALVRRADAR